MAHMRTEDKARRARSQMRREKKLREKHESWIHWVTYMKGKRSALMQQIERIEVHHVCREWLAAFSISILLLFLGYLIWRRRHTHTHTHTHEKFSSGAPLAFHIWIGGNKVFVRSDESYCGVTRARVCVCTYWSIDGINEMSRGPCEWAKPKARNRSELDQSGFDSNGIVIRPFLPIRAHSLALRLCSPTEFHGIPNWCYTRASLAFAEHRHLLWMKTGTFSAEMSFVDMIFCLRICS